MKYCKVEIATEIDQVCHVLTFAVGMSSGTPSQPFLTAVLASLPIDYASRLKELCRSSTDTESLLDIFFSFIAGGECPPDASSATRSEWTTKQRALSEMLNFPNLKRPRGLEPEEAGKRTEQKRPRITQDIHDENDPPLLTIHSVSVTSPIRKKVDITVRKLSLTFANSATNTVEASIQRSSLARAFLFPTRGKSKPHWTVVLLSSDVQSPRKGGANGIETNMQVAFGIEATAALTVSTFTDPAGPSVTNHPKGSETLSSLRNFLSYLSLPVFEPSKSSFRSAIAKDSSGMDAYLGAKAGTLWFLNEGILWEGKPCEFWALRDLASGQDAIRLVSATGRMCSVVIKRKGHRSEEDDDSDDDGKSETVFSMVDGKEQEGIRAWSKEKSHLFGVKEALSSPKGKSRASDAVPPEGDDSDAEDSSFATVSSDSGSPTSDSSESEQSAEDAEESAEEDGGDDDETHESIEDELKPENHPLMRPGAMPRMSKAAMDMVVGIIEDDLMTATGNHDHESEEQDELED
jgi:hypothetical protein